MYFQFPEVLYFREFFVWQVITLNKDEEYMREAIELARYGWGKTNPNPLVGAVIVKDGVVIAKGWHERIGCAHAEVSAFNNACKDVTGGTMYVNLEPCSHHGRTPPCAHKIVEKGIKKVVVGMVDPNPKVAGKGIEILKNAGIEVVVGVLEEEAKKLNEIFIKYILKKKPFVIMKTAMTLDGKIATVGKDSKWITCESSRKYVHRIRDRVSAVMVGINTVINDNPSLTTRLDTKKGTDSVRIVVDSFGRIPENSNVITVESEKGMILVTTPNIKREKKKILEDKGIKIIEVEGNKGHIDLNKLMDRLYELEIDSVLLEGGGGLNASALKHGIVDKVMFFIAPKIIGGCEAVTPVEGEGIVLMKDCINIKDISIERFDNDILIEGYII